MSARTNTQIQQFQPASDLTAREHAAIQLRVPDSGTDYLDAMIRKSLRQEFAKAAMQGMLAHSEGWECPTERVASYATDQADHLLAELEKEPK